MNPTVKEGVVGAGVFVATAVLSTVASLPFGSDPLPGHLIAAALVFGGTFLLARALRVESFNDGMFRGSVWLMVTLVGFLLLSIVTDSLAVLGYGSFFIMLACIAGGPMLAGRLVEAGR